MDNQVRDEIYALIAYRGIENHYRWESLNNPNDSAIVPLCSPIKPCRYHLKHYRNYYSYKDITNSRVVKKDYEKPIVFWTDECERTIEELIDNRSISTVHDLIGAYKTLAYWTNRQMMHKAYRLCQYKHFVGRSNKVN